MKCAKTTYSFHKYLLNRQWEWKGRGKNDKFMAPVLTVYKVYWGKNVNPRITPVNKKQ